MKDQTAFTTTALRHNSGYERLDNCRFGQISNIQTTKNFKNEMKYTRMMHVPNKLKKRKIKGTLKNWLKNIENVNLNI